MSRRAVRTRGEMRGDKLATSRLDHPRDARAVNDIDIYLVQLLKQPTLEPIQAEADSSASLTAHSEELSSDRLELRSLNAAD